jgi:hypothetical protein
MLEKPIKGSRRGLVKLPGRILHQHPVGTYEAAYGGKV